MIEEGEKPSKYFFNLASRNFLNKTIKKIYVEGIGMVYEQAEIVDRYIGKNTGFIYDILSFKESHNIPGLLVLIHVEKAFDSMSWYFFKILELFGFGEYIIDWIKISNTKFGPSI